MVQPHEVWCYYSGVSGYNIKVPIFISRFDFCENAITPDNQEMTVWQLRK